MPIRKIQCNKCSHEWELFLMPSEDRLLQASSLDSPAQNIAECPKCGGIEVVKCDYLPTSGAFILKGRGWFKKGGY